MRPIRPDRAEYAGPNAARAAVIRGIDAGFPKSAEALRWLDANLPNQRKALAENPVWAIVPRK